MRRRIKGKGNRRRRRRCGSFQDTRAQRATCGTTSEITPRSPFLLPHQSCVVPPRCPVHNTNDLLVHSPEQKSEVQQALRVHTAGARPENLTLVLDEEATRPVDWTLVPDEEATSVPFGAAEPEKRLGRRGPELPSPPAYEAPSSHNKSRCS